MRTYQAFGVHGGTQPDPQGYYADPGNPLSAGKNSFNIILTLISDAIIVSRRSVPPFGRSLQGSSGLLFPHLRITSVQLLPDARDTIRADADLCFELWRQVYRTFVLWTFDVRVIILPVGAILANIGSWLLYA